LNVAQVDLSIIIPVFNKWELTRNCLHSLREHTPGDNFEVIVVDNASSDETSSELPGVGEALFGDRFQRIANAENLNFGPACNQGARASGAPFLFFLNNDTLLTPGWLPPLLQAFVDENSLGAVGPLLLYADNTVQHLGVTFSTSGIYHLYNGFPVDHPALSRKRNLQAITGAALLLPKALFFEIGSFYEEYKNGFEDVDLCLQLHSRGKILRCITTSRLFHLESQTPGRRSAEDHNSGLLTSRCHALFNIDMHQHGLRDGFQPVVDDMLSISLIASASQDMELRQQAENCSPELFQALAKDYPYWVWGQERLGELAYQAGRYVESCYFMARAVDAHTTLERYRKLLHYAMQAKDFSLASAVEDKLLKLKLLYGDHAAKFKQVVKMLLYKADQKNDKLLRRLLEEKTTEVKERSLLADI
jgi:GT2 family glycosyltransferase